MARTRAAAQASASASEGAAAGVGGAWQRRRRASRSHSSCRRRRTPPPRGQSAGRPPTRRRAPCAARSSDREMVSSDREIVPEAKVSPLGAEGPEVTRALSLTLTLTLSLTLTLTRGRWARGGGAARLRPRELRGLLAPMADGAAAPGSTVHLPHAWLCLAAQPRVLSPLVLSRLVDTALLRLLSVGEVSTGFLRALLLLLIPITVGDGLNRSTTSGWAVGNPCSLSPVL